MAENAPLPPPPTAVDPADVQAMIEQSTRVWDSPGVPNRRQPPIPGRTGVLRADPTREYVSSQPNQWYLNLVRVLSFSIDDVTADFGDDLYQRMRFDPIVSNAITTIKADVVEDGISLRPAINDEDDPGYEIATTLVSEAEHMLDQYAGGNLDDWLWQAADAIWQGNTASEVTFAIDRAPSGRMQFVVDRLAVKPVHSYGFAVDTFKKLIGIMGLIPGIGMPVYSGNIVIDPEQQPNMLPRDKFAIYTHRPQFEDPRGTSIARPVYTPWNLKMNCLPEYAKWLKQFASAQLVGISPPDAMAIPLVDGAGNLLPGTDSTPIMSKSPEATMLDALIGLTNGAAAVFPNGSTVTPIEMHGMGQPLLMAFKWFDDQISTGILGQTMTSSNPKYGTQALGAIQQDTLDTIVRQIKAAICKMIWRDVLRLWVKYTFGEDYMRFTPKPSLGQVEEPNLKEDLPAYNAAGYTLDPSQFPDVDKRLGMATRAPGWQEAAAEQAARATYLNQEAWTGGSAVGQSLGPAAAGGEGGGGGAAQQEAQQQQQEKVQQARKRVHDARWHESVKLASTLRQKTGVRLDPDADPLTAEELSEVTRDITQSMRQLALAR